MFGFDVKQIFTERIYEVIFVLCLIHLGVVAVSFLLNWIHPYLKNYSVMHNNHENVYSKNKCLKSDQLQSIFNNQYTKGENQVCHKTCHESNRSISEEEYVSIMSYLGNYVDASSIPQEILEKQYYKGDVLNEMSLKVDNGVNIRKLFSNTLKKMKSSREAQTNVTISPTFKAECVSPKLIFSSQSKSYDTHLHLSESSDSFKSVCSNHSESKGSKRIPINLSLGVHDSIQKKEKSRNMYKMETVEHDEFFDVNSLTSNNKVLKTHVELLRVENHNDYDKQVSQENKILEMAINEFENELKPIKDQIKVLKECLNSFDCYETDESFVSDLSSSVSDPITQSECYSEEVSTTFSSDQKRFSSKRYKMLEQKFNTLKAITQYNRCKPYVNENTATVSKNNSNKRNYKILRSGDKCTSKCPKNVCVLEVKRSANDVSNLNKRSPIADMYIKLSHCSSQASSFVKNSYKQKSSDKSITCHINLNVILRDVTLSSTSIKSWVKEREIKPVLSEPEDILGEESQTVIESKPDKNNDS